MHEHAAEQDRPSGDVHEALARIDTALDRLYHQADRLGTVIAPILSASPPDGGSSPLRAIEAARSQLGSQLDGFADRIVEYGDLLAGLSDRVQL